jgi:hypothetical protein
MLYNTYTALISESPIKCYLYIYLNILYTALNIVIFSIFIYNIEIHVARVHIFSGKYGHPCTGMVRGGEEKKWPCEGMASQRGGRRDQG